jgi:hypothetical protein
MYLLGLAFGIPILRHLERYEIQSVKIHLAGKGLQRVKRFETNLNCLEALFELHQEGMTPIIH